jgi:hypothetical protein
MVETRREGGLSINFLLARVCGILFAIIIARPLHFGGGCLECDSSDTACLE